MKGRTQEIVDVIEAFDGSSDVVLMLKARFPDASDDELNRAIQVAEFENVERIKEHEITLARLQRLQEFREGLPDDMTLAEAIATKAAVGDETAQALLAEMETPEWRRGRALAVAAIEAHPGWVVTETGQWERISDDAPETPELVVDWFQLTHPREARAIERSIEGGAT